MRATLTSTRRAIAIAEFRSDPESFESADDAIAGAHVAQLPALGGAVGDDDHGVHALPRHVDPASIDPHLGSLVGRRIEVVRHRAVAIRRADERVAFLGDVTAERDQRLEQGRERGTGRRRHLEAQPREVLVGAANLEVQHLEGAAAFDHGIEDRIEELRIDQVPFGLDDRAVRQGVGHVAGIIALSSHSDVV
jgi:hypothetical protein